MKKIIAISAIFAAVIFSGCNSGNSTRNTPPPPQPQPIQPIQPIPDPEPQPTTPDVGTGSVSYSPSCMSGFATVQYVFQSNSSIDSNSFIIVHLVNGYSDSISSGSVTSNGSVSYMKEDIYIKANDTQNDIVHQVQVKFISDGLSQVDTFSFMQPTCEVKPKPEPEPEPKPVPKPNGPAQPYAPNTAYDVGDVITIVDAQGVTRTYICNTAYVSSWQGTWARFSAAEIGNWTRIANLSIMKVDLI